MINLGGPSILDCQVVLCEDLAADESLKQRINNRAFRQKTSDDTILVALLSRSSIV